MLFPSNMTFAEPSVPLPSAMVAGSIGDLYDTNDNFANLEPPTTGGLFDFMAPGFLHAFVETLSLIIVSELGDKTFFIAAILAMKGSRTVVFVASMLALGIMTVLASALGVATTVIPKVYIHWTSIVLFVVFGLKMLKEGYDMSPDEAREELANVQSSIENRNNHNNNNSNSNSSCHIDSNGSTTCIANRTSSSNNFSNEDPETGVIKSIPEVPLKTKIKRKFLALVSLAFIETFTMIFLAEWGDRSQISTLVLAARENFIAVTCGAILGHFLCTGLAVVGGRFIAQRISVKTVTTVGGVVFLLFATFAAIMDY